MKKTYCIVGAGPCGLMTAKTFKKAGIAFDVFEKHNDVGGIWDMKNTGTPLYDAAHFISSRTKSGFPNFPMPDSFPDYPNHHHILTYIRSYAQHENLYQHIQFNTKVTGVEKHGDDNWLVTTDDGKTRNYAGIVCCNGTLWTENMPILRGQFDGTIRHGRTFKYSTEFVGKRILVMGGGNSGVDIACEAATFGNAAFLSLRRGYHFIPKYIFGKPSDVFADEGPKLPRKMEQWVFEKVLKIINGDQTRLGLPKPDHKLLESHPVLNSQIFHHLQHGNIKIKPDVDRLEGHDVVFTDGNRETIDEIICATGYNFAIPYAAEFFDWTDNRPQLYLNIFNPKHDNIFTVGFIETNAGAYAVFQDGIYLLTQYLLAKDTAPQKAAAFRKKAEMETVDMTGKINFVKSARATGYVDADTYRAYVKRSVKLLC
jgi:hypothetical protein